MELQLERVLRDKKPVPEIDFTLHTMEDGTQVSTLERVCKGNFLHSVCPLLAATNTMHRGASARSPDSHR
jgi:hypothetical protein